MKSTTLLFAFSDQLNYRTSADKVNDEAYRTIPALNGLVAAALIVTSKLSHESRDALLLQDGRIDPVIRLAKVELGMRKRHEAENAEPDLDYFMATRAPSRKSFEEADPDMWMPQPNN